MYLPKDASRARIREAQKARENRAEIVRALSHGEISRRELFKWGLFTSSGLLAWKHGDHISGLMAKDTNAQMFPDAEIVVPAAELKWWTQPIDSIPQPRRALAQRIQATLPTWKNVKAVDGEADVAPGVRAIPAHGHTQGHTAHLVSSGANQLLVTADATNIAALFVKNPEWQGAFDHVPDQAVETRKKLFDRAIADKAMVAGYHWGLPNVGTLAKDGKGYAFTPAA